MNEKKMFNISVLSDTADFLINVSRFDYLDLDDKKTLREYATELRAFYEKLKEVKNEGTF